MKNIVLAAVVAVTGSMLMFAPAQSASMANNSMYCRNNTYDPICMDAKMFKMRMKMMGMTKSKAMASRSKYCRTNNSSDPICKKQMMNNSMGY